MPKIRLSNMLSYSHPHVPYVEFNMPVGNQFTHPTYKPR